MSHFKFRIYFVAFVNTSNTWHLQSTCTFMVHVSYTCAGKLFINQIWNTLGNAFNLAFCDPCLNIGSALCNFIII